MHNLRTKKFDKIRKKKTSKIHNLSWVETTVKMKGLDNTKPTEFATSRNYQNKTILDLGCGNGRDTYYFEKNNKVIGVDPLAPKGKIFFQMDLEDFLRNKKDKVDVVYCRFLLHIIPEHTETFIINWASRYAKELAIEVRAMGDVPVLFSEHKRRFANPPKLIKKILAAGFSELDIKLGYGLARLGPEDPYTLRIVARHEKI